MPEQLAEIEDSWHIGPWRFTSLDEALAAQVELKASVHTPPHPTHILHRHVVTVITKLEEDD